MSSQTLEHIFVLFKETLSKVCVIHPNIIRKMLTSVPTFPFKIWCCAFVRELLIRSKSKP